MYSNLSPSTKEPLVRLTSTVPLMYALAPVVCANLTSNISALAPVFKPTTSNPAVRF